jgi:hypothetical protein
MGAELVWLVRMEDDASLHSELTTLARSPHQRLSISPLISCSWLRPLLIRRCISHPTLRAAQPQCLHNPHAATAKFDVKLSQIEITALAPQSSNLFIVIAIAIACRHMDGTGITRSSNETPECPIATIHRHQSFTSSSMIPIYYNPFLHR